MTTSPSNQFGPDTSTQSPTSASSTHPTFTVDTHLFRELGELLVGRDSTALVELIKNSYDADATSVVVYGEALSDPAHGYITITDNGTGMSRTEFESGFLRIASRSKAEGDRRSALYSRRYTGEKGVGRLAAHKLARLLEISSLRWDGGPPRGKGNSLVAASGLQASIDWHIVESVPTLDEIIGTEAISVVQLAGPFSGPPGTTITLRRLRSSWTKAAQGRFLEELQAFTGAPVLTAQLPRTVLKKPLLFACPAVRDPGADDEAQFVVKLDGELAPPDDHWQATAEAASWILEIDALSIKGKVRYGIAPTEKTREDFPEASKHDFTIVHPAPETGPFFQARILMRAGKSWEGRVGGIRVFVEGFRLLPYGEPRNDWLSLDRDTAERRRSTFGEEELLSFLAEPRDESLQIAPNKHYFGAIFLTQDGLGTLRTLVNREGFVPDAAYEHLVQLVRSGLDLLTRARAAASETNRDRKRSGKEAKRDARTATGTTLRAAIEVATVAARDAKRLIGNGDIAGAEAKLAEVLKGIEVVGVESQGTMDHLSMVRVLASVGTQMASFIHEINSLLGTAESVDHALRRLKKVRGPGHKAEQDELISTLTRVVGDLRRNLERQASYLVDVVTPDARRRRVRLSYAERFEAASKLVSHAAELSGVVIENGIPGTLKSPPMFSAELTTVFSNLLTNAVKAAGKGGRVRATAGRAGSFTEVRVENTGVPVLPEEGERWFKPFESTTTKVDAVLGQGMGLGLTITRSVLGEYGALIRFVKPTAGFSAAVELVIPA